MMARLWSSSLLLVFCITMVGCGSLPGHPKPGPEVPRPDSVLDFATLYRQNCSGCHGARGMNGPSYPLANANYQALVDVYKRQAAWREEENAARARQGLRWPGCRSSRPWS